MRDEEDVKLVKLPSLCTWCFDCSSLEFLHGPPFQSASTRWHVWLKRWLSSAFAGKTSIYQWLSQIRVVSDRRGGFLSHPLPPSHPTSLGPQVGLLNNHGADPTRLTFFYSSWGCWNTSRQTKDTLKQRSATQHVCLGAGVDHLLTLSLTGEKHQHKARQDKTARGHGATSDPLWTKYKKNCSTLSTYPVRFFFCFVFFCLDCSQPEVCVWLCGLTMATRFQRRVVEFFTFALPPTRRGESKCGSWKWLGHMGNNSTLWSERTHKRPHYLSSTVVQPARTSHTHLLKDRLCAASDAPFGLTIPLERNIVCHFAAKIVKR